MFQEFQEFQEFPKIARLNRPVIVTEKIDGTNAQIFIPAAYEHVNAEPIVKLPNAWIYAGSRNRLLTLDNDNYGFASWVYNNAVELAKLGPGRHFGEWWGSGIQRGYGLPKGEKRFSLFNVSKWSDDAVRPACCHVVPVIAEGDGLESFSVANKALQVLKERGSFAAPGFMNPEGIIAYHTASNKLFKATIHKDQMPKSCTG